MSRLFYHTMQDNAGNLLFDVSGTMRLAGSGTLATIYGDEALTVILPNPMTNHPSFGSFKCFLPSGDFDFYMSKSGYSFETLTGVQGHGTMAQQDASAVAITGGTIGGLTNVVDTYGLSVADRAGNNVIGVQTGLQAAGGTGRYTLYGGGDAPSYLAGPLTVTGKTILGSAMSTVAKVEVRWDKTSGHGISMIHNNDAGGGYTLQFLNATGVQVGSISQTASATAYTTSSDARLKHAVTPLTGALAVVQALRPITHLWRADDSRGVSFLAHEVADVVDGVISGERDAVDEEGRILPQMIDMSKLVPWLCGAIQELAAKVVSLETQLGV